VGRYEHGKLLRLTRLLGLGGGRGGTAGEQRHGGQGRENASPRENLGDSYWMFPSSSFWTTTNLVLTCPTFARQENSIPSSWETSAGQVTQGC
jgi:hypothetical protein